MPENSRETILARLKGAVQGQIPSRPSLPPLKEPALKRPALTERFVTQLTAQGGMATQVANQAGLLEEMETLLKTEKINRAMATTDAQLAPLRLPDWGAHIGVEITTPATFSDRARYTRAIFDQVQAGITGVAFAVAESGTLVLTHRADQARLVSLAPLIHIAVVPAGCIVPTYESAITAIYSQDQPPSQVTMVTGPSMTADIQGTPFKGMHGPQKLFVFILG